MYGCTFYINPGVSRSESPFCSKIERSALCAMDDIVFYQPPSASKSRPPRLPGVVTALNTPRGTTASLSHHQTVSQASQQNGISKDQIHQSSDVSDLPQKGHPSDRRCGNDTVQEQENLTAARNSPNSDDDDFPEIDELLSGIPQKSMPASADPNGGGGGDDDDSHGFIDIDELLSGMQQKSVPASADLNSGGMAEMVDNGTRGGSPTYSSRSTAGSSQDPIILSDDESAGAESGTDCSDLDLDVRAKSDSEPPDVADSELADGDGFSSGAALTSDRLVTDHQDDDSDHDGGVDITQHRLSADRPRPASPDPGSDTRQANKLQLNTDIIRGSTSYETLNVTKALEGEGFDVVAEGDDVDCRSTKGRTLSAVSDKSPASGSNISGPQDGQPDDTQSPQLALAAASPHQSHLKNDHLPKQLRRGATRNYRRNRSRTIAPIRLATTASTASAAPESTDLKEAQLRDQITAPYDQWEVRDIDQEVVDDRGTDDSNDEDYSDMSDATGSKIGGRPHSRKRVCRTKGTEDEDVEAPSIPYLDVSDQAIAETSSGSMQKSEEIPIHGYFTLKTNASEVVYCLTFSQELLPRPQDRGQRQDCTTELEEPQSAALVTDPSQQWEIRKIIGQKMIGCERHYRVKWKDTWMPESELAGAKEMVDAFMANDGSGTGGRKRPLKRSSPATVHPDTRVREEPKRRRGRPQKQK